MKKWLKIMLIVLAVIAFLLAIALMLVSPIAKNYLNRHGKDIVGREVNIEKLRVNAISGKVRICDFTLYEDDGETAFFSFDTLDVSVKLRRLLVHELNFRHIILAHPHVRIVQQGDRFNFSSIIDYFASDGTDEPDDTVSNNWRFGFYNIRLSNGEVLYADLQRNSNWNLNDLSLKIPGIYFDGSANTDAGLALQLADGGILRTEASLNMESNNFNINLELEKFAVSNVKAYLADVMNVGKIDGILDANISVKGSLSDLLKMNIGGDVSLKNVDIHDNKKVSMLVCDNIAIDIKRINLHDNLYDVRSVAIEGLASHLDIYNDGSNFSRLFDKTVDNETSANEETVHQQEAETVDSKPLVLKVGSFILKDAEFVVNDYSLPDRFSFPIKKINISAENINTIGDNKARLSAQLPHGGSAFVNWHGNIDEWKRNQSLSLSIRNLQLKDLSPYSVAYLGWPLIDGTFSFTSNNNVQYSQLTGQNELDLFNPEVGDKRKEVDAEMNIPLKAALYVLKDKDGKIQFDVPVTGNIDSPEFSYMKIVWKTLGNLIVKVATSPFRAVSKALGISGDLEFITFNPQQVHFTSEQYSTFNKIAEVLSYDSTLVVTLEPNIDMESSYKAQSIYLLKEEYYMTIHPERVSSLVSPQVVLFNEINGITVKDSGFVAFVRSKGITAKRPSDKDVQRLAERLYTKDAAVSSLEILSAVRDDYVYKFFTEQNDIDESQIKIAPLVTGVKRSGYSINSEVKGVEE